jgi:hypothetical protein
MKAPQEMKDISNEIFEVLLKDLDTLPTIEQLSVLIATQPLVKIPSPHKFSNKYDFLYESSNKRTSLHHIFETIAYYEENNMKSIVNGTEDQVHHLYDAFFQDMLDILLNFKKVSFEMGRNSTESEGMSITTKSGGNESSKNKKTKSSEDESNGKPRPDYLLYVSICCEWNKISLICHTSRRFIN